MKNCRFILPVFSKCFQSSVQESYISEGILIQLLILLLNPKFDRLPIYQCYFIVPYLLSYQRWRRIFCGNNFHYICVPIYWTNLLQFNLRYKRVSFLDCFENFLPNSMKYYIENYEKIVQLVLQQFIFFDDYSLVSQRKLHLFCISMVRLNCSQVLGHFLYVYIQKKLHGYMLMRYFVIVCSLIYTNLPSRRMRIPSIYLI